MKIITWNINGYRAITGQNPSRRFDVVTKSNKLFDYLMLENPDIICLQETKAEPSQIEESLRQPPGYLSFYSSCKFKKGYSGVSMFFKHEPELIREGFGIPRFDDEGRLIEAHFGDIILLNVYFPKGEAESERLKYKLDFYDSLSDYVIQTKREGKKLIICGDFNTAHHPLDLARPNENINTSGFMPIERERLDTLVKNGFTDAFRLLDSGGGNYTWWSQRGGARSKNIGWRLDYFFISENIENSVRKCYIQPHVLGSDHCPVILEI